jgi:protein TonB
MRTFLIMIALIGVYQLAVGQSNVGTVRGGSDKAQRMFDGGFRGKDQPVDSIVCAFPMVVMPKFPGGNDSLTAYISRSFDYPTDLGLDTLKGKIYVEFTIDEQGQAMDVKTKRGIHPLLDAEAERVIRSMPRWRPGMENNMPVKTKLIQPISVRHKEEGSVPRRR